MSFGEQDGNDLLVDSLDWVKNAGAEIDSRHVEAQEKLEFVLAMLFRGFEAIGNPVHLPVFLPNVQSESIPSRFQSEKS